MFGKIGVPLDGSKWAERALPLAVELAEHFQAELFLLEVKETGPINTAPIAQEINAVSRAEDYLEQIRFKLRLGGGPDHRPLSPFQVHTRVLYGGSAANRLTEFGQEEGLELFVMSTHGQHDLKQRLLGSVATRLRQQAKIPILLVGPHVTPAQTQLAEPVKDEGEFAQCPARPHDQALW